MAERPAEDKSGILPETSIVFYGIPAYGHLHSNLYLTGCLSAAGYRVVYYSMEPYRREIEANGCEFRAYPLDRDSIDASDGDKPLKLYRLILEYTRDMLPHLLFFSFCRYFVRNNRLPGFLQSSFAAARSYV